MTSLETLSYLPQKQENRWKAVGDLEANFNKVLSKEELHPTKNIEDWEALWNELCVFYENFGEEDLLLGELEMITALGKHLPENEAVQNRKKVVEEKHGDVNQIKGTEGL